MNDGDNNYYKIPDTQEVIAQYLLIYSMSGDPGDFNNFVDYDYQRTKLQIMLTTSDQEIHLNLYKKFKTYAQEIFGDDVKVEFGGEAIYFVSWINYIVIGKIQNIILAILIILIFCIIVFRSFSGGLISIVPLTISTIITFGCMGFLGIRLEVATSIMTAVGIGIGVDFSIHYLSRFKKEIEASGKHNVATKCTMLTAGKAIIYDVLSNLLGFCVFIFSGFTPLQYFGWLVSLTMITVAFGSLILFPPLFTLIKPKFIYKYSVS